MLLLINFLSLVNNDDISVKKILSGRSSFNEIFESLNSIGYINNEELKTHTEIKNTLNNLMHRVDLIKEEDES